MGTSERGEGRSGSVSAAVAAIRENASPLSDPNDLDRLVEAAADTSDVLRGEASHGASEVHSGRTRLTTLLISEWTWRPPARNCS